MTAAILITIEGVITELTEVQVKAARATGLIPKENFKKKPLWDGAQNPFKGL